MSILPSRQREERIAASSAGFFVGGRLTNRFDFKRDAKGHSGKRMISVKNHVFRVDVGHRVGFGNRFVSTVEFRQLPRIERVAFIQFGGKVPTWFQKNQFFVVVTEPVLRLQMQIDTSPGGAPLQ